MGRHKSKKIGGVDTRLKEKVKAYIYNKGEYTYFRIGHEVVRFATSPYLNRYVRVKEYDNGYIVVDAEFCEPKNRKIKHVEEDYLDISYVLKELGLDTRILEKVTEVEIL